MGEVGWVPSLLFHHHLGLSIRLGLGLARAAVVICSREELIRGELKTQVTKLNSTCGEYITSQD